MRGHHPAHTHCRSRFRVRGVYEVSRDLSRREMCRRIKQWSENTVAHISQQIRLQEHSPRVFSGAIGGGAPFISRLNAPFIEVILVLLRDATSRHHASCRRYTTHPSPSSLCRTLRHCRFQFESRFCLF